jgi:uncharacterized membrane protein
MRPINGCLHYFCINLHLHFSKNTFLVLSCPTFWLIHSIWYVYSILKLHTFLMCFFLSNGIWSVNKQVLQMASEIRLKSSDVSQRLYVDVLGLTLHQQVIAITDCIVQMANKWFYSAYTIWNTTHVTCFY